MVLLFKSLTHDQNIAKGRDALRVGVLSAVGNAASAKDAAEVSKQIEALKGTRLKGLVLSGVSLSITEPKQLQAEIARSRVNVVYICAGADALLDALCELAAKKRILLISGDEAHGRKCAAITAVSADSKPKLLLNLSAAMRQGASFDQGLLRAAKLLK